MIEPYTKLPRSERENHRYRIKGGNEPLEGFCAGGAG